MLFQRKIGKLPAPRLILLSLWIIFKTLVVVNCCLSWKLLPHPQSPQLLLWPQGQLVVDCQSIIGQVAKKETEGKG